MDFNEIDLPEADYLYTQPSQLPGAGKGLYTAIDIYKDEVIAVFKGKKLTAAQAKARALQGNDRYFINMPDGGIIDSMPVECFAKYANDAKGTPNALFKNNTKIALNDENVICLVATKAIKAGAEIFCSYGNKYWAKRSI